jgi:protein TonB
MSYASQQQGLTGPKLVSLIIALAIVGSVGLGMVVFLAVDAVKEMVERVTTVEVKEEEPPPPPDEPPPPEEVPEQTSPPPPVAPPPPFDIAPNPPQVKSVPIPPPPQPVSTQSSTVAPPGPPTPPAPPSKARGARTKNERSWAARIQENYPARALREETEGTVGVRVTVTADGRATGCSVTASSGSSILDAAACTGMERYARFDPALDAAGNPTSDSYSTRITYRLN